MNEIVFKMTLSVILVFSATLSLVNGQLEGNPLRLRDMYLAEVRISPHIARLREILPKPNPVEDQLDW